jgi:hypothetical protein
MTKKNIHVTLWGSGRMMVLRTQGGCKFDGVAGLGMSWGWRCHGLGEDDGAAGLEKVWVDDIIGSGRTTVLWAWGRCGLMASGARGVWCCCRLRNSVVVFGTAPAWSAVSPAWVGEDGGAWSGSTVVRNDDLEALGMTWWRRGSSREDSMMAWFPGRSTAVRAPGKFLVGNFDSLTARMKASVD